MEVGSAILLTAFYAVIFLFLVAGVLYAENIVAAMVGDDIMERTIVEKGEPGRGDEYE